MYFPDIPPNPLVSYIFLTVSLISPLPSIPALCPSFRSAFFFLACFSCLFSFPHFLCFPFQLVTCVSFLFSYPSKLVPLQIKISSFLQLGPFPSFHMPSSLPCSLSASHFLCLYLCQSELLHSLCLLLRLQRCGILAVGKRSLPVTIAPTWILMSLRLHDHCPLR